MTVPGARQRRWPRLQGPWRMRWQPRGGSLCRLLLVVPLAALWGLAGLVLALHLVWQMQNNAEWQDNTLRVALLAWPAGPADPGADALAEGSGGFAATGLPGQPQWFRETRLGGERVAGSAAVPPVLAPHELGPPGQVRLYLAEVDGQLARVAATLHQPAGHTAEPVVRQVARRWNERLPTLEQMAALPTLRTVGALALAMSAVLVLLANVASAWLRRADASLEAPAALAGLPYEGPSELAPAVAHLRALQAGQSRWIDEQRRFLADATHQLRTPMAVLRTQLQSAIHGDVLPADALQQMLHTVDRASGLANQLLSLSKVEQLKRMGGLPSVDLNAVAREAVMELAPLIAAKRLDFALEGPALSVPGDAALLGELMRNLLANAIHHTPAHGRLGVLLRDDTGWRELLVWDEGPGIDDGVRQRLFQPFSAGKGGVGLGLSICRQIAEAMGAEVTLFNRQDEGRVVGVDALVTWGPAGGGADEGHRMHGSQGAHGAQGADRPNAAHGGLSGYSAGPH